MPTIFLLFGIVLAIAYLINRSVGSIRRQRSVYYKNAQLIGVLVDLDAERFNEVLSLYTKAFGIGPGRYARATFKKWKTGRVLPTRRTFDRFYRFLPAEMSFDLKCEILRKLKQKYCLRDVYDLTVNTDDWKRALPPLIESLADKARTAEVPRDLQERVHWLSQGEGIAANAILAESQARETVAALSFLDEEFSNIEALLEQANGRAIVKHSIELPYGTINLKIKKA